MKIGQLSGRQSLILTSVNKVSDTHRVSHPILFLHKVIFFKINYQNDLGVVLDSKLTFHDHLDTVIIKVKQTIYILCKKNSNNVFHDELESIQYNSCLIITGELGIHRGTNLINN